MQIKYSKSLLDISKEGGQRNLDDQLGAAKQKQIMKSLLTRPLRKFCILCGIDINGDEFLHRGITFIRCNNCDHIQTKVEPPGQYPYTANNAVSFADSYPKLTKGEYEDRKNRIYRPKLDWIVSCLSEIGSSHEQIRKMRWVDIGCGAGYFLSSLKEFGISDFVGYDLDDVLIKNAREALGSKEVCEKGGIEETIQQEQADIYTAFFILEHIPNLHEIWQLFKKLKAGTYIAFSVPVFGFTQIWEHIFQNNMARNLNCVSHTQNFTDDSIKYAMDLSDMDVVAEWVFGQDIADLYNFFDLNYNNNEKWKARIKNDFIKIIDELQNVLDRNRMSDQRHVLARKR